MNRNRTADVLKGLCIIFIIITHYGWSDEQQLRYLFPFIIDMAVPILMIISGYVYTASYERAGIDAMYKAYEPKVFVPRMLRFLVPFTIAYIIEQIILFLQNGSIDIIKSFLAYFQGGVGLGNYYTGVMLQFVFVFPVIYFIIRRYRYKGLLICGLINLVYEFLHRVYGMDVGVYRYLLLRYIFVIAYGCYLSHPDEYKKKTALLAGAVGVAFQFVVCYLHYEPIIIIHWTRTCCIACLYIIPIIGLLLRHNKFHCKPLEFVGKVSYTVYLTQMIYYHIADTVYTYIGDAVWLRLLVNITICLLLGTLFYYISEPLTKAVIKLSAKLTNRPVTDWS